MIGEVGHGAGGPRSGILSVEFQQLEIAFSPR
jgi:hypothetical protein